MEPGIGQFSPIRRSILHDVAFKMLKKGMLVEKGSAIIDKREVFDYICSWSVILTQYANDGFKIANGIYRILILHEVKSADVFLVLDF